VRRRETERKSSKTYRVPCERCDEKEIELKVKCILGQVNSLYFLLACIQSEYVRIPKSWNDQRLPEIYMECLCSAGRPTVFYLGPPHPPTALRDARIERYSERKRGKIAYKSTYFAFVCDGDCQQTSYRN